jgi:hypothetical protein
MPQFDDIWGVERRSRRAFGDDFHAVWTVELE